jgi:hypothetical protein
VFRRPNNDTELLNLSFTSFKTIEERNRKLMNFLVMCVLSTIKLKEARNSKTEHTFIQSDKVCPERKTIIVFLNT